VVPQTDRASAFVVHRIKIFLISNFITMQNLDVVSYTVCAPWRRSQKFWGRWGPDPWDEGVAVLLKSRSQARCYHIKFGRSRSNRLSVGRWYHKVLGTLVLSNVGFADP